MEDTQNQNPQNSQGDQSGSDVSEPVDSLNTEGVVSGNPVALSTVEVKTAPEVAKPASEVVKPASEVVKPAPEVAKPASEVDSSDSAGLKMPEILQSVKQQPTTTSEEKIWALLSYVPFMALVALIMKPESDFVKLHGRQGLLLFIIFLGDIFIYLLPFVGGPVGIIVHFAAIIVGLFSMYQAFIGNWWKIPVLGDVADLIPIEAFSKVARSAMMGEKVDEEKRKVEIEQESKMKVDGDQVGKDQSNDVQPTPVGENSDLNKS